MGAEERPRLALGNEGTSTGVPLHVVAGQGWDLMERTSSLLSEAAVRHGACRGVLRVWTPGVAVSTRVSTAA